MFGLKLRAGHPAEKGFPAHGIRKAHNGDHLRRPAGQRSSLVKNHPTDCGQPLQCVALANQEPVPRGVPDGRHDGRRRSQHQGAGTEHHENGDGADDLSGKQPGNRRSGQRNDHDPGGPPVCQTHDLCLSRVGGLNQTDQPLDGAVLSHPRRLHVKGAELVHGSAGHLIAGSLIHRKGFPGHHGLVDGGLPGHHPPVHRHGLPGENAEPLADLHLPGGNDFSAPPSITRAVRGVRCTSLSMPARALATVSSSRRPPSCMMNATSPAANPRR